MTHTDPLSTKKYKKKSSKFYNPLKNALKVQFSVLNRAENASMAPHYHPRMCQWLQNFIPIGVNGSRISSLSASTAPEFHPYRRQWLQIAVPEYVKGSKQDPLSCNQIISCKRQKFLRSYDRIYDSKLFEMLWKTESLLQIFIPLDIFMLIITE